MSTKDVEVNSQPVSQAPGFVSHWGHRAKHWFKMFSGTSYYHADQGLGQVFVPGEVKGYFNDMTAKAQWAGNVDQNGLPVSRLSNGVSFQFPILLCQKALGHWDLWLQHQRAKDKDDFLAVASWLKESQDSAGGWDTWGPMGQPSLYRYSAMTQGEAMSVLTRAYICTGDQTYLEAAGRAFGLIKRPVNKGGVSVQEGDEVFLEEFPGQFRDTVLNGWMFALFGLYDYALESRNGEARAFLNQTQATLVRTLPKFDAGFWSYYSVGTGRLASPFYHRLHLSQLEAFWQVTRAETARQVSLKWSAYEQSRFCKGWAVLRKGLQKIREPREVTIVG